jgi:hypothetical protein
MRAKPRESYSKYRADKCEHSAFCKELPDYPAPRGSERLPQRHFSGAKRCACQQQIGHIHARQQKHQPDRAQQHQ